MNQSHLDTFLNSPSGSPLKPEDPKSSLSESAAPSAVPMIRFLDDLPPDVGLHIARIIVKHGTVDDAFNLAKASELQKSYVFQAMDYKLPTRYPGRSRSWHWIGLMNGNIREIDISESKDLHIPWAMGDESLCCMPEFYQLDLKSIEKVTVNGVPSLSLAEFLSGMSKLRSLAFTGQLDMEEWNGLRKAKPTSKKDEYRVTIKAFVCRLCNLPLEELRLECTASHDNTYARDRCAQNVIFCKYNPRETWMREVWTNRSVRSLCVTYSHGDLFLCSEEERSRYRNILAVFPFLETLTCLKAPLQNPTSDEHLEKLKELHLHSDRPSLLALSECLSPALLNKLVTFECTNYTLSFEDVSLLLKCEKLLHLTVKIARGAEQSFLQGASPFKTLSLEWESPEPSELASHCTLHKPLLGLLPNIVAKASELQQLGWLQAELSPADLLETLKLLGSRLLSLKLTLNFQSTCALQYLLTVIEGIALHSSNLRELDFPLYGHYAQKCLPQCSCNMEEERIRLEAAIRNVQVHAPLLHTTDLFITKNQVLRDHSFLGHGIQITV